MPVSNSSTRTVLLNAQTDSGAVSVPFYCRDIVAPSFYIKCVGTITTGTLIIEEADWAPNEMPYSGTWSVIQPTSSTSSIDLTQLTGGKQQALHITGANSFSYIRFRIGTGITGSGGSVTVTAVAAE